MEKVRRKLEDQLAIMERIARDKTIGHLEQGRIDDTPHGTVFLMYGRDRKKRWLAFWAACGMGCEVDPMPEEWSKEIVADLTLRNCIYAMDQMRTRELVRPDG